MVENNELPSENNMDSKNVKLITDQKKLLEETTLHMQQEIKNCFEHLVDVLRSREKQLLRQVEAVHVQQLWLIQSNFELVSSKPLLNINLESKYEIQSKIQHLGKLEVLGQNCLTVEDTEPYKVEEYQEADKDHESFNKSIKSDYSDRLPLSEKQIEYHGIGDATESIPKENAVICKDSILNLSCNSSLDSKVESETKLTSEAQVLASPSCMPVDKEFISNSNHLLSIETKLSSGELNSDVEKIKGLMSVDSLKLPDLATKPTTVENFEASSEKLISRKSEHNEVRNSNFQADINANKKQDCIKNIVVLNELSEDQLTRQDSGEHPKQIQQWLQQILVETETEPMIHEIEQFSEISKVRLSGQFPLET